ncbi:MAG: signal peptidase I [Gammaproteobacteria bacterium]|nr:signal peptidase I [Gammaproteobacteria bacterium]
MSDPHKKQKDVSEQRPSIGTRVQNIKWGRAIFNFWREWRGFFVFIVLMLLFRSAIADWNHVPSGSMNPGIIAGDRVVVDKIAYDIRWPFTLKRINRWSHPKRGDIVTFPSPEDERTLLIKRVIGVGGDKIELHDNRLFINNVPAVYTVLDDEEIKRLHLMADDRVVYVREEIFGHSRVIQWHHGRRSRIADFGPFTLAEDEYFMMGDNRDDSKDSRAIGAIERDRVIGRAHTISFSFNLERYWLPRLRRFFIYLE